MRILDWLGRRAARGPQETGGAQAATEARERLVAERDRTRRALELARRSRELADQAIASRRQNHYAQALREALGGRP